MLGENQKISADAQGNFSHLRLMIQAGLFRRRHEGSFAMQPVARNVFVASSLNPAAPLRDTTMDAGLTFARGVCAAFGRQLHAPE
jgi:hypothetical protein